MKLFAEEKSVFYIIQFYVRKQQFALTGEFKKMDYRNLSIPCI